MLLHGGEATLCNPPLPAFVRPSNALLALALNYSPTLAKHASPFTVITATRIAGMQWCAAT